VAPHDTIAPTVALFDKSKLLANHPLFRELEPGVRDRICAYMKMRDVPRGATIFSKGDPGTSLFAVSSGVVEITVPSLDGKNVVFNLIKEGEVFGEIALLDGQPRTADAVAFTDCRLLVIERRDFISLLRDSPDITMRLIEVLCARLRRTTEQVEDLMFLDLGERLAKTLLRLSDLAEPAGSLSISQSQLSQIVGMSREMINKQLQVWARYGWVRLDRRRLTVLDSAALGRILAKDTGG
jgi:CRP-like cAMP-binding protein